MYGICGIVNSDQSKPVRKDVIEHMTGIMVHRGPDSEVFLLNKYSDLLIHRI